jgi:hypothetical protein
VAVYDEAEHVHRRVSWSALFGGVVVALGIQLVLSMLGAAIGFGTVNVHAGSTPDATTLGIGAGVWWIVETCVALFAGSYVAAWLAGADTRFDGILHGLIVWGITMLLVLYLLTSTIGNLIGGGFSMLGSAANAAGSGISAAAKPLAQAAGVTPEAVENPAQAFLQPNKDPAAMSPQEAQADVTKNLAVYAKGGADAPAARERVITVMAAQLKVSHDEAARRFDETEAKVKQTKDQAVASAKTAADASAAAASKTAFAVTGMLLLAALAAGFGGAQAVRSRMSGLNATAP